MGVRFLQTYIMQHVPDGFVQVSIIEECRQFTENNNGAKPILVFDLMGLSAVLNIDPLDVLFGRNHYNCFEIMESLFRRMASMADLVFFEDGPVINQKYETWLKRQDDRYHRCTSVIDKVKEGRPVKEIAECRDFEIPFVPSGIESIEKLADLYGKRIVTVTKECDAELAQFACSNSSVIAVLAGDTDFLIFPGQWKYLSIKHINIDSLMTMEFSRAALRKHLQLDDKQLIVLSTIAGNDIIQFEEVSNCHRCQFGLGVYNKFPAIARMIREKVDLSDFNGMLYALAEFLLGDTSPESIDRIYESFSQYNIKFEPVDHSKRSPLLDFCRKNGTNHVYKILRMWPVNFAGVFVDLRRWPYYFKSLQRKERRQIGIILQHMRPGLGNFIFDVYGKKNHDENYQKYIMKPEYPPIDVPDLLQLIDRDNYKKLDKVRFDLLKWSIDDALREVDLSGIPVNYLRIVLTLYQLVATRFITIYEADLILLSIKRTAFDSCPLETFKYPDVLDEHAFGIAFLFLCCFDDIERSMEVCGLKDLATVQNFNGPFFHKTFFNFKESGENPASSLKEIDSYRIYKTL